MKHLITTLAGMLCLAFPLNSIAQNYQLDVNGSAKIDSSLIVKDSVVGKNARFNSIKINSQGATDGVLIIDAQGNVKRGGELKSLVYQDQAPSNFLCPTDLQGNPIPLPGQWNNGPGTLFTNTRCIPDVKVGIGLSAPTAKLHIKTSTGFTTHPLLIEQALPGNATYKLLQLESNGLLHAREIKVDLFTWPDYVFEKDYRLMPLEEVGAYIQQNKHLPNVPSACEMESSGMNIAETNVMLMEKLEETTLYLLQLQEEMKRQQKEIEQLKSSIQK